MNRFPFLLEQSEAATEAGTNNPDENLEDTGPVTLPVDLIGKGHPLPIRRILYASRHTHNFLYIQLTPSGGNSLSLADLG